MKERFFIYSKLRNLEYELALWILEQLKELNTEEFFVPEDSLESKIEKDIITSVYIDKIDLNDWKYFTERSIKFKDDKGNVISISEMLSKPFLLSDVIEALYKKTCFTEYNKEVEELRKGFKIIDSIQLENKDIIITDPCYIFKKGPNIQEYKDKVFKYPKISDNMSVQELWAAVKERLDNNEARKEWYKSQPKSDYSIIEEKGWKELGFTSYLTSSTFYGDWSCTTYNSDTKEVLGKFCADGGEVGVFILDEVLANNPKYDDYIKKPWTTTLIKNFTGTVYLEKFLEGLKDENKTDEYMAIRVIGKGNINFETKQTGL